MDCYTSLHTRYFLFEKWTFIFSEQPLFKGVVCKTSPKKINLCFQKLQINMTSKIYQGAIFTYGASVLLEHGEAFSSFQTISVYTHKKVQD